ncbi:MAG: YidC/Oxa1 family membrane protein insertase [Armatimonadota bacterium]
MKINRLLYIIAALVLVQFLVSGCARINPTDSEIAPDLLKRGIKLATEAQKTEGSLQQGKKFISAIKPLDQAAGVDTKKNPDAATIMIEATLAKGKIYLGVPVDSTPKDGMSQVYHSRIPATGFFSRIFTPGKTVPLQNPNIARDTFRVILQRFDSGRTFSDLKDKYGKKEAREIRALVVQAQAYEKYSGEKMDSQNRGKVLYKIMDSLVLVTGRIPWFSYWFAIILLTVIVKILITPLTKAQFKGMKDMQRIQPLVKELQEKYKDDQRVLGEKMMKLYKDEGVNPLAGCLPILIQMPILILVYTMIRYYEQRFANGTFLWIGWHSVSHLLSVPIMSRPVWITAANLAQPDLILLVLYTISMVISQRISIVDPTQAEQQKAMSIMMPVMFFFIIGYLPSAFVLYWLTFNILQTWQQYHIIHGVQPVEAPSPAPAQERRPSRRSRRNRR